MTSLWKINLPIPLASRSTLSVSYAANLMALLLLGPQQALVIALVGVWTQCTINVRRRYPWYRTAFSIGAEALTMLATGLVYQLLGGAFRPVVLTTLAKPLVAAIAAYFFVNTGLDCRRHRPDIRPHHPRSVDAGFLLERRQLHGRGQCRRCRCRGDFSRRAMAGDS